jgi:predicted AAA+ superfamily ATPase
MRYIKPWVLEDLKKKMVFIGGPRQVGKTTFAKNLLAEVATNTGPGGLYLNWDYLPDKRKIQQMDWADDDHLLVFDELHKLPKWKSWIKGVYDVQSKVHRIIVTGSARLDVYRRGGDSLLGRYHHWRLHPFSLSELPRGLSAATAFERLLRVGGFPEPFLDGDERAAKRWRNDRFTRIIKDDVRDLESIRSTEAMSLLVELLRTRVGQPLTISKLAGELQVSPKTVDHWIEVLEKMYVLFVVRPYAKNSARAILKQPKVYFFDNADVDSGQNETERLGARLENLVATHLLKQIHFTEDSQGDRGELRYVRDKEGHEVDFAVIRNGQLEELVEVKWADAAVSRSLQYFAERLKPARARQIVGGLKRSERRHGVDLQRPVDAFPPLQT